MEMRRKDALGRMMIVDGEVNREEGVESAH